MVLWALIPLLSPLVFSTAARATDQPLDDDEFLDFLATQGGLAYACLILLWGTGVLYRQASVARGDLARRAGAQVPDDLFHRIGSIGGPLILTAIVVAVTSGNGWATYGPVPPIAALPLLAAYMIPIATFVWVDVAILFDLDRLGRQPMLLDLFPQDRTLGLERLGALASSGLGLLLVAAVPVLLAGSDEPVTLGTSLAIVGLAVGVFVLSMWRLHRQMVAAKSRYVAMTRDLYAEAYAPVRATTDLPTLTAQSTALGAAQALDERAHGLPTWPIDEGTLRFVAVVVTGVVTSLVVRALLATLES